MHIGPHASLILKWLIRSTAIVTEVFRYMCKVFICLKLRMGSAIVQHAARSGYGRRCWNWIREEKRRLTHRGKGALWGRRGERREGEPLKWRWREGRTRTRQPYLRANIGQHYARYTSRNTRTPFPCIVVCIYHQAERNSEGDIRATSIVPWTLKQVSGKEFQHRASTANRRIVTCMWLQSRR